MAAGSGEAFKGLIAEAAQKHYDNRASASFLPAASASSCNRGFENKLLSRQASDLLFATFALCLLGVFPGVFRGASELVAQSPGLLKHNGCSASTSSLDTIQVAI